MTLDYLDYAKRETDFLHSKEVVTSEINETKQFCFSFISHVVTCEIKTETKH